MARAIDLLALFDELGLLALPHPVAGWNLAAPGGFAIAGLCQVRWWNNSAASLQALQIELGTNLLTSSSLEPWVARVRSSLLQSLALPDTEESWPLIKDKGIIKAGGWTLWGREYERGKALVVTAGLAPCKQCGAPPGPASKRCWECDFAPGLLGFLRKKS